jgi:hypothetical protein
VVLNRIFRETIMKQTNKALTPNYAMVCASRDEEPAQQHARQH